MLDGRCRQEHSDGPGGRRLIASALLGVLSVCSAAPGQFDRTVEAPSATEPLLPDRVYLRTAAVQAVAHGLPLADARTISQAGDRIVLQLNGPMTAERRKVLEESGVRLMDYLPSNAFIVSCAHADPAALQALDFVRWWGVYEPGWKVDPMIGLRTYGDEARLQLLSQGRVPVQITLFADASGEAFNAVHGHLQTMPEVSDVRAGRAGDHFVIGAIVPLDGLDVIAGFKVVQFIEETPDIALRNDTTRWIVQSNRPTSLPFYEHGIRGEGQIVGIIDDPPDQNHCSLTGKAAAYNAVPEASPHGTHVTGTCVGDDGVDIGNTRGVAYAAAYVFSPLPPVPYTEADMYALLSLHHEQGASVHNNSWGDEGTTDYNGLSRAIDRFAWEHEDDLVVVAVSNGSFLKNPENAKNCLAVGASQDTPIQSSHCLGGTGPTVDGRRKPEIYAPGCATLSAQFLSGCMANSQSGTSMAAPAISGTAALIRQYFQDGFHPTGIPSPANGMVPSGALLKAMMLNGSVDMTGIPGYPSDKEGWGRLLADDAVFFPGDDRQTVIVDRRNVAGLETNAVFEIPVEVDDSSEELRLTLTWTEPPASASAGSAAAWINDLDLEATGPGGMMYLGNVFSGGRSVPGGMRDVRNNVEQIRVETPAVGQWMVRVRASAVNVGPQGFALVASGGIDPGPQPLAIAAPGAPELIPPGEPTIFSVYIAANDEMMQPGSEMLHYRYDDGSFKTRPLAELGNGEYLAVLPAPVCAEAAEYFITASGSESGMVFEPESAPLSTFEAGVGIFTEVVQWSESFEAGLAAGWSADGLWRVTSECAVQPLCDGPSFAYFGESDCDYANGLRVMGTMESPAVPLPALAAGERLELRFCYTLETEADDINGFDQAEVYLNGILQAELPEAENWTTRVVDISSLAGGELVIEWRFDSIDNAFNTFRGWQVDGVEIVRTTVVCIDPPPACPGDASGDNAVDIIDLNIVLGNFAMFSAQGDLNGDLIVDFLDLNLVLGNFNSTCTQAAVGGDVPVLGGDSLRFGQRQ